MTSGAASEPAVRPPVLSIGARLGDSDVASREWQRAISCLGREVVALRSVSPDSPLRLNVVFVVDGKLAPLDFDEVQTGRFRRVDKHLMIQVPVHGQCPKDARPYLADRLRAAVEVAEGFAQAKKLGNRLDAIRGLLLKLG